MTLIAYVRDTMARPTLPADYVAPEQPWRLIIREVAEAHGVTVADILGPSQKHRPAHARQEAMWRMRTELKLSFPRIAKRLNRRNHTTAIFGVSQHERRIAQ